MMIVKGDKLRFEQVLQKLIGNAVRYGLPGGVAQVHVARGDKRTVGALDGFAHIWVSSVNQLANLLRTRLPLYVTGVSHFKSGTGG